MFYGKKAISKTTVIVIVIAEVKHKSMRFSLDEINILQIRIPVLRKLQITENAMSCLIEQK